MQKHRIRLWCNYLSRYDYIVLIFASASLEGLFYTVRLQYHTYLSPVQLRLVCTIIWYLNVLFKITSKITFFHKRTFGVEKNVNINVEIIYLRSIIPHVSFSIIFIENNTLYIGLFIKYFSVWYTSKTCGASAIECSRNKVLWI